jgi:hypothetical protein
MNCSGNPDRQFGSAFNLFLNRNVQGSCPFGKLPNKKGGVMQRSNSFFELSHKVLMGVALLGLCAGIVTPAVAKEEPVKKEEHIKQSGNILVKFHADVSEAKIQEVADHFGARHIKPLSEAEMFSHKNPGQWRKFRFEAVDDLKSIAWRINQDNRVIEVE